MSGFYSAKSEQEVSDFIFENFNKSSPLEIVGYNSKKIGRIIQSSQTLSLGSMSGILEYFPEELYIKVLPGTSIEEIESELRKKINF